MTAEQGGAPGSDSADRTTGAGKESPPSDRLNTHSTSGFSVGGQLRARWFAALRLGPMPDGRHDPLQPISRIGARSVRELDAWAWALRHLAGVGLVGVVPPDVAEGLARHPERYAGVPVACSSSDGEAA